MAPENASNLSQRAGKEPADCACSHTFTQEFHSLLPWELHSCLHLQHREWGQWQQQGTGRLEPQFVFSVAAWHGGEMGPSDHVAEAVLGDAVLAAAELELELPVFGSHSAVPYGTSYSANVAAQTVTP